MKNILLLSIALLFACNNKPKELANIASTNHTAVDTIIERWQPTEYRNKNWHPEDGQYFFSEQWSWHFFNENLSEGEPHKEGKFSVYVDPSTGTIMLNRDESHYMDEMTEWIIIEPSGTYISGWTDHDGGKYMERHDMNNFVDHAFRVSIQEEDFKTFFSPTGEYEKFGANEYGWETVMGKEWIQSYMETDDKSTVYTTALPFSIRPLYLVEQTNQDLQLPVNFRGYGYLLPSDALLLQEVSEFYGKRVGFKFKSMSPTEYFLDINSYKEVK